MGPTKTIVHVWHQFERWNVVVLSLPIQKPNLSRDRESIQWNSFSTSFLMMCILHHKEPETCPTSISLSFTISLRERARYGTSPSTLHISFLSALYQQNKWKEMLLTPSWTPPSLSTRKLQISTAHRPPPCIVHRHQRSQLWGHRISVSPRCAAFVAWHVWRHCFAGPVKLSYPRHVAITHCLEENKKMKGSAY